MQITQAAYAGFALEDEGPGRYAARADAAPARPSARARTTNDTSAGDGPDPTGRNSRGENETQRCDDD